jgi:hypothetical protein
MKGVVGMMGDGDDGGCNEDDEVYFYDFNMIIGEDRRPQSYHFPMISIPHKLLIFFEPSTGSSL